MMQKVFDFIEANRYRFVQELLPFVAQPSLSTTGEGVLECAQMLKGLMEQVGIETRFLETGGFPVVYGEVNNPEAQKTLLFLCHYDVVPAGPLQDWPHPPFTPTIEDNRIWGRGVGDAKGQLYTGLKALEAWKAVQGDLPVNLHFLFIGDEETGCPTLQQTAEKFKEQFQADAVFFPDASTLDVWGPILFLGNRGVLALELSIQTAKSAAHSGSYGGLLKNPALILAQALASMRDQDGRILIRGFYDDLRPIGVVEQKLLAGLQIDTEKKLKSLGASEFWGDPGYSYFETQMYRPTLNIHGLTSGYQGEGWMAAVPASASAKLDINIIPNLDPAEILQKLRAHLDEKGFEDVVIKVLADLPYATAAAPDSPFLEVVARAQESVWGMKPVIYPSIGGAGDLVKVFTDTVGVKYFLMVPLAQPDLNEHTPKESLDIDWFINGIKTVAALVDEYAKADI